MHFLQALFPKSTFSPTRNSEQSLRMLNLELIFYDQLGESQRIISASFTEGKIKFKLLKSYMDLCNAATANENFHQFCEVNSGHKTRADTGYLERGHMEMVI